MPEIARATFKSGMGGDYYLDISTWKSKRVKCPGTGFFLCGSRLRSLWDLNGATEVDLVLHQSKRRPNPDAVRVQGFTPMRGFFLEPSRAAPSWNRIFSSTHAQDSMMREVKRGLGLSSQEQGHARPVGVL